MVLAESTPSVMTTSARRRCLSEMRCAVSATASHNDVAPYAFVAAHVSRDRKLCRKRAHLLQRRVEGVKRHFVRTRFESRDERVCRLFRALPSFPPCCRWRPSGWRRWRGWAQTTHWSTRASAVVEELEIGGFQVVDKAAARVAHECRDSNLLDTTLENDDASLLGGGD